MIYNDTSVLEMHHLAVGFKLMMQDHCGVFDHFSTKQWQLFRKMIVDMVRTILASQILWQEIDAVFWSFKFKTVLLWAKDGKMTICLIVYVLSGLKATSIEA